MGYDLCSYDELWQVHVKKHDISCVVGAGTLACQLMQRVDRGSMSHAMTKGKRDPWLS